MAKIRVEVCLISARGLRRTSSLWKLQWFAVGWIDPNNKYCTNIHPSGNSSPIWKTKFATLLDDSIFHDAALHVQVYSREPLFLRETLQGTATVVLKEFLANYSSDSSRQKGKQVGSYQLRKKSSSKPQGFIDVSIHISEDRGEPSSNRGDEGGLALMDHGNDIASSSGYGGGARQAAYPSDLPLAPPRGLQNQFSDYAHVNPMPYPTNHPNQSTGGLGPPAAEGTSYNPPRTLPPPPPPSNVGYVPTFLPNSDYVNMPSSLAAPRRRGMTPSSAMGVGAGALAAGAVIFGDDFMSGFSIPSSLPDPSLTISTDPPF